MQFCFFSPFEDVSIQLKLSSPPSFKIHGGRSERDGGRTEGGGGQKFLCIILDSFPCLPCLPPLKAIFPLGSPLDVAILDMCCISPCCLVRPLVSTCLCLSDSTPHTTHQPHSVKTPGSVVCQAQATVLFQIRGH